MDIANICRNLLKSRSYLVIVAVSFFILMWAFTSSVSAVDELRIGVPYDYKDTLASSMWKGAVMASEEINAQGGVLGKQIRLMPADTREMQPGIPIDESIRAVTLLIERERAQFILGAMRSDCALAIQDLIAAKKMIFINPGSTTPTTTKKVAENYEKYKYYFRTYGHVSAKDQLNFIVPDFMRYLRDQYGIKSASVIYEDCEPLRVAASITQKLVSNAGYELLDVIAIPLGTLDISPEIRRLMRKSPDMLLELAATDAGSMTFAKHNYEMRVPALAGVFFYYFGFQHHWTMLKEKALYTVGGLMTAARAPVTEKTIPWFDKYVEKWGQWPYFGASGAYAGLYMLVEAINKTGNVKDTEAIIKALEEITFAGPYGLIELDPKSHETIFKKGMITICQFDPTGKLQIVYPNEFATSQLMLPPWSKFRK